MSNYTNRDAGAIAQMWVAHVITNLFRVIFRAGDNLLTLLAQRPKRMMLIGFVALASGALSMAQLSNGFPAGVDPSSGVVDQSVMIASDATVPAYSERATKILTTIGAGIDKSIQGLGNNLASFGTTLTFAGLAIGLLWAGVKCLATSKGLGEWFAECVPLFVATAVVMAFLQSGVGSIKSTMDMITTSLVGSNINSASAVMADTASKTMSAIKMVTDMPYPKTDTPFTDFLLGGFIGAIMTVLMKIVAAVFLVLAGATYVATAIMAMVGVALVVALAPVMVPFLIFRPTAWLFDSWLKFLLGACMIKLVGAFMLKMTLQMLGSMNDAATQLFADNRKVFLETMTADLVLHAVLIFVAVLSALLMAQVPSIASGLLAGSAGGAGFAGLKAVRTSLAAKGLSSGGSSAYKGAKSVVQSAPAAARATVSAARSAASSVSGFASAVSTGRGGSGGGAGATSGVSPVSPMSPTSSAAGNPYANMQTPAYMRAAAAQRQASFVGPIQPGP